MFKKHSYGFTLVELLVAIAASLLIFAGTLGLFNIIRNTINSSSNRAELVQNGRVALEQITRDLRQAATLVTSIPKTNNDPQKPPPSILEFQDGHDTQTLNYIRYYLLNRELHREFSFYAFLSAPSEHVAYNTIDQFGTHPTKIILEDSIIAEHISNIQFYGSTLINVYVTLSNNGLNINIPTTIFTRNTTGN